MVYVSNGFSAVAEGWRGIEPGGGKFHFSVTAGDLTSGKAGLKYRNIPENPPSVEGAASGFMTSTPFPQPQRASKQACRHERVQIVSREEDAEFVECLECREIFESSELKDMGIEETTEEESE